MPATELMDLLRFDDLLDDEQRLIQKTVRSFVQDKVKPHIADWYERGVSPRELAVDLEVRLGAAEAAVASAAGRGRGDRLLRADRARLRIEPGRHAHPGGARWR